MERKLLTLDPECASSFVVDSSHYVVTEGKKKMFDPMTKLYSSATSFVIGGQCFQPVSANGRPACFFIREVLSTIIPTLDLVENHKTSCATLYP
jgi:hypothetical protein